jgi:DNA-binding protein H-NS
MTNQTEALDNMRDERNQAHAAYSRALNELADLRNAIDIANARADRQAARADKAEAELARQKRVTTLMAKVAREMTKEDEPAPKQLDPNVVDWIKQRLS